MKQKWKIELPSKKIVSRGWHVSTVDDSTIAVVLGENMNSACGEALRLIAAAPDMYNALEITKTNLDALLTKIKLTDDLDKAAFNAVLSAANEALRVAAGATDFKELNGGKLYGDPRL